MPKGNPEGYGKGAQFNQEDMLMDDMISEYQRIPEVQPQYQSVYDKEMNRAYRGMGKK